MADATRTIRTRFDGDASGLVRAAKRGEDAIDRFGKNAGRSFATRFRQFLTGENDPSTFGTVFGKLFGSGILRGLAVPGFGPAMLAVLVPAAVAASTVVGALLASGVVLAFGAGLAGLGIAFAAQSARVKSAFTSLTADLATSMRLLTVPFRDTLVEIAGFMRRTFEAFVPTLRAVFDQIAPAVTAFADHFFTALEKFRPAVKAISTAFGDLLAAIGPKLGPLFADIADTITGIAQTVSKYAPQFADLITFFLDAADAAVEFIGKLAELYGLIATNKDTVSTGLLAPLGVLNEQFGVASQVVASKYAGSVEKVGSAAGLAAGQLVSMNAAMAAQRDIMLATTNPVFALTTALTGYEAAQKASDEAVKEFGASSTEATDAGIALAQATAQLEAAATAGDLSFSAFDNKLAEWVATGRLTAAQAAAIRARVAEARGEAEDFQGDYKARFEAQTAAALARIEALKGAIAGIRDRTITVTVRANLPAGLTARGIEYYESLGFSGESGGWFANGGNGTSRTQPPESLNFTATIPVYLDGRMIDQRVHTIVAESESRSAWRATVGRR